MWVAQPGLSWFRKKIPWNTQVSCHGEERPKSGFGHFSSIWEIKILEGGRKEHNEHYFLTLTQVVLFLYKYAKKQREKRGLISPHPSIHRSRKPEKKPGVLKSLRELAGGCMKTWILFLTGFNYSHQKKINFPEKSKDISCSLFVNTAQIPSQSQGWMVCSDKCLIKLTKVNILHLSLGWPCKF